MEKGSACHPRASGPPAGSLCHRASAALRLVAGGAEAEDEPQTQARLRSLTLIKGLVIPPKTRAYLDYYEAKGDVPLYDVMAL